MVVAAAAAVRARNCAVGFLIRSAVPEVVVIAVGANYASTLDATMAVGFGEYFFARAHTA